MDVRNFSSIKKAVKLQIVDKKLFSPEGGRIALSANERIAEFLDFAIQAQFAYANKLKPICQKTTNLVFPDTCG